MRPLILVAVAITVAGCSDSPTDPFADPPVVAMADPATHPPIPAGLDLNVTCLQAPDTLDLAEMCPVIEWGGYTYWADSDGSNAQSMTIVAYDANDNDVLILERAGARYVWQITIDEEAETVTVWGQSNRTITFTWDELRI